MSRASSTASPAGFARVQRQFEAWRRRRAPGMRIPESLWAAAVELAQKHGVSRTAQALSLDYYSLKRRTQATPRRGRVQRDDGQQRAEARFLEMPLHPLAPGPACTLELEDGGGARLHMKLHGLGAADLAMLLRSLWSEACGELSRAQR